MPVVTAPCVNTACNDMLCELNLQRFTLDSTGCPLGCETLVVPLLRNVDDYSAHCVELRYGASATTAVETDGDLKALPI
jgi:hypothetical protein